MCVERDGTAVAPGTDGRIVFGKFDPGLDEMRILREEAPHYASGSVFEQLRRGLHLVAHKFVNLCIADGTFESIFFNSRLGLLHEQPNIEGEVRSYFALLGQHAVAGTKSEIAQCDFQRFECHFSWFDAAEPTVSSASLSEAVYFLSARTTPDFQVLMASLSSWSESMSRMTLSSGMR